MKYAIYTLKLELSALKSHMRMVADTEFKMDCADRIEEIKKAIKILKGVKK